MSLAHITVSPDTSHEDRAQAIRDTLRDAIVDRRLAPGTKLSESEVGTLFDVSRTVVRAALQMLAYEGLVKAERNRGAFVSNPPPDEARLAQTGIASCRQPPQFIQRPFSRRAIFL